jgi:hypothetical protein
MRISQSILISAVLALLALPALGAQDLSKYRGFSLGSSLAVVSREAHIPADRVTTVHKSPALMQQLTVWPIDLSAGPQVPEDVQQMQLSFCDGQLYSIAVMYRTNATEGLTADDMIRAISLKYGVAVRPVAASNPQPLSFDSVDTLLASWQDSQYSAMLSRSPLLQSFQLVVLSRKLQAQADAATTEAVAQESEDAPQRETARVKKEADDAQTVRDANLKAFRP